MKNNSLTGFFIGVAAAAVLSLPFAAYAESHEARAPLTDAWIIVPKTGMETEFEEAVKKHMAYRAEKEDSRRWMAYQPTVGSKMNMYQYRACCYNWADMDTYETESQDKGFNENWNVMVHPYVDHYHHYLEENDWENSHWPDGDRTAGPYFAATNWYWKENAGQGPSEARKEFSQIALKNGWADEHEWIWISRIGGKPMLALVTPQASYADMADPDPTFFEFLSEQLGSEEAANAMFDKFGAGFSGSDFTVWMRRDDLSDPRDEQ